MNWITDAIAIGDLGDAMNYEELEQQGIRGILCLNDFPTFSGNTSFEWYRVQLKDGPGNTPQELQAVLITLDRLLEGRKVLVHCAAGVSRAPFVVSAYLARKRNLSIQQAAQLVAEKRTIANIDPALLRLWDEYLATRSNGNGQL